MIAFRALSLAILRGFVRDRFSLFFALVFPLMFLVLFGGLLGHQGTSKVRMIEVGHVALFDDLGADGRTAMRRAFDVSHSSSLPAAIAKVRKGDADVAVEMSGGTLVAHYTQTDQTKASITQVTLMSFVDGANISATGSPPRFALRTERVEDRSLTGIQFFTPGLLGWAVAMSASFGAAATLQNWRQSKLIRRLQLAPVSTRSVVAARVLVTVAVALAQMAVFLGLGIAFFGLVLTGSWLASMPLLVVGTLCFMAVGLLAGAITRSTEGAVNAANFMVLPMSFLSGSFFPLEVAPRWVQQLAHVLPLYHLNQGMTDVLVRGQPASAILLPMAVLAG
ncbi:MAG: ABC transporter permease, partial [Nocardioides sp.]|nr:ABC transporter permease [Nocardioides sp.]